MRKLIAGPSVYICDECIDLCNDIIAEEVEQDEALVGESKIPRPKEIKEFLDQINNFFTLLFKEKSTDKFFLYQEPHPRIILNF